MREAGDRTTWTAPDEAYEAAVHAAVDAAHDDERVRAVLDRLLARVVAPGWSNALAAKLLSLTIPGVPDVYQGSELWEQSLVDPDNRRFVDFDLRAAALGALAEGVARTRADRRRRRPGHREAAGHPGGAHAAPRAARAVHVVRRGGRRRRGRRTTRSPSTAAARSPW